MNRVSGVWKEGPPRNRLESWLIRKVRGGVLKSLPRYSPMGDRGGQCGCIIGGCEQVGPDMKREGLCQGEALGRRQISGHATAGHDGRQHGPQIGAGLADK